MPKITSPEIEKWEREEQSLQDQLSHVRSKILNKRLELCEVKVGDLVKSNRGEIFKVTVVNPDPSARPWVKGLKKLTYGSWGIIERDLYGNWEKVKL